MKQHLFIITLILIFVSNHAFGQETKLYEIDGKLKLDTLLKVDMSEREAITVFEDYLLPEIYSRIEYPLLAFENSIQGVVICKLKFSKPDNLELKIERTSNTLLNDGAIKGIKCAKDRICRYLNLKAKNSTIEFYLPVIFEIKRNKFLDNLGLKHGIVIQKEETTMQKMLIIE